MHCQIAYSRSAVGTDEGEITASCDKSVFMGATIKYALFELSFTEVRAQEGSKERKVCPGADLYEEGIGV